jgi:E3 ubiquitin-protein ligase UHRF1
VGGTWKDRIWCKQWGSHLLYVSGHYGNGVQPIILSVGYIDDKEHGRWVFYTKFYLLTH